MQSNINLNSVHISVVSPVYKAELILDELVRRLQLELSKITDSYEIILVEDAGPDRSWEKIEEICEKNNFVKGIKLSRNFGQHYAITAGLDYVSGDWTVVMDCDLQDRPEEIINLYNKANEGYQIVYAQRSVRSDTFLKKLSSFLFYKTLGYLTDVEQDHAVANFGIYSRNVIAATTLMREKIRYFPSMVKWVGFKFAKISVQHAKREEGKTSYNLKKLLRLAKDIMLAYSDKPLRLTIKLGLLISFLAFVFAIRIIILWFLGKIAILGYASLITSIWLLSGIIIFLIGTVGLYIGKIFEDVKNRPIYIIEKKTNL